MHDINKFELQHRARLKQIYESVVCPQTGCAAEIGSPCRNVGAGWGTLTAQAPRIDPHQVRKIWAIDQFLAAAGVGVPVPPAPIEQPGQQIPEVKGDPQTEIFDAEPAPWAAASKPTEPEAA